VIQHGDPRSSVPGDLGKDSGRAAMSRRPKTMETDPIWQTGPMIKGKWLLVMGVVVIGAIAAVGWWVLRDTTTPVAIDVVQGEFGGAAGSSAGDPGIYRYRTSGFEEIDALSGARHEYPDETFMTISVGECGPVVRWDALEERWIDWDHCGPDLAVSASATYHEWFGIPDLENETCADPRPIAGIAGEITTTVCEAEGILETYETTIMGQETLDVAGVPIETTHLRRTSSLSGGSTGDAEVDVWRANGTALVVRMEVVRRSATPSAVGDVTYSEEFVLDLIGLAPGG